jgi:hypothetical protein
MARLTLTRPGDGHPHWRDGETLRAVAQVLKDIPEQPRQDYGLQGRYPLGQEVIRPWNHPMYAVAPAKHSNPS